MIVVQKRFGVKSNRLHHGKFPFVSLLGYIPIFASKFFENTRDQEGDFKRLIPHGRFPRIPGAPVPHPGAKRPIYDAIRLRRPADTERADR